MVVPHLDISGGVRIALNYAHFLGRRGNEVRVISSSRNPRKRVKNILEGKRGSIAELFDGTPYWFRHLDARVLRVPSIAPEYIPDGDVVVDMSCNKVAETYELGAEKGRKFEFITHDERLYHKERSFVENAYRKDTRKICISDWLQEIIKRDFGQESDLLVTPVDAELFFPDSGADFDTRGVSVAMLHHNYPWKGVDDGLYAYTAVRDQTDVPLRLVLFGARFRQIDVPCDEYHYDPKQEKLRRIYSRADIFLCPSEWEGLGMPAMEAMACRTAVVTFDTGGSRSYAFDGDTAFVAHHGDRADLARKLRDAVRNDSKRERIAARGYEYVTTELDSWSESAAKLEAIFQNAV